MEWGTRPSMMTTFLTPRESAFAQHSTFGIIPPEMMPLSYREGSSGSVICGMRVEGSFLSFRTPAVSERSSAAASPP